MNIISQINALYLHYADSLPPKKNSKKAGSRKKTKHEHAYETDSDDGE